MSRPQNEIDVDESSGVTSMLPVANKPARLFELSEGDSTSYFSASELLERGKALAAKTAESVAPPAVNAVPEPEPEPEPEPTPKRPGVLDVSPCVLRKESHRAFAAAPVRAAARHTALREGGAQSRQQADPERRRAERFGRGEARSADHERRTGAAASAPARSNGRSRRRRQRGHRRFFARARLVSRARAARTQEPSLSRGGPHSRRTRPNAIPLSRDEHQPPCFRSDRSPAPRRCSRCPARCARPSA
jgi:hypothetical protein